jgi:phosphate transport system substrate-binding protein
VSPALVFAGCDANIPITRRLARAFMERRPDVRIDLKTVGSTNAVALVVGGGAHIGLLSRPLRDDEYRPGLRFAPYARTAVIIGADPDTRDTGLASADLLDIYRGAQLRWSSGRPITLLTREDGDSSVASLKVSLPGFAEAYAFGSKTIHRTVLYSEPAMHEALLMMPAALGLSDLGALTVERLPIRALAIDGVEPTLQNLARGRYPFTKTLGFVWHEDTLPGAARAFVEFVASNEGAGILSSSGYLSIR